MKVKIVKFNNGLYAVQKGIFFHSYADIHDMSKMEDIFWWSDKELTYTRHYMTSDLELLETLITRYNPKPNLKVERVMSSHKIKD